MKENEQLEHGEVKRLNNQRKFNPTLFADYMLEWLEAVKPSMNSYLFP